MNLRCLAQTAAVVSWFGSTEIRLSERLRKAHIAEYWKSSRFLFRLWNQRLQQQQQTPASLLDLNRFTEEVITSELLTRCLSAYLLAHGEVLKNRDAMLVAKRSIQEHADFCKRLLSVLEMSPGGISAALRCERLQRKMERWSDLLISSYSLSDNALEAAFDKSRCLDFGDEWHLDEESVSTPAAFQLQLSALTLALPNQEIQDLKAVQAHAARCAVGLSFISFAPEKAMGVNFRRLCQNIQSGMQLDSTAPRA